MIEQLSLIDYKPPERFAVNFRGETFDATFDGNRLNAQQKRVHDAMVGTGWMTLREIAEKAQCPEASASARFRDFRNDEYLSRFFLAESIRKPGEERRGIWLYRVTRRS